jgi:hypothetical protein
MLIMTDARAGEIHELKVGLGFFMFILNLMHMLNMGKQILFRSHREQKLSKSVSKLLKQSMVAKRVVINAVEDVVETIADKVEVVRFQTMDVVSGRKSKRKKAEQKKKMADLAKVTPILSPQEEPKEEPKEEKPKAEPKEEEKEEPPAIPQTDRMGVVNNQQNTEIPLAPLTLAELRRVSSNLFQFDRLPKYFCPRALQTNFKYVRVLFLFFKTFVRCTATLTRTRTGWWIKRKSNE